MHDLPRQRLRELLERYGPTVCDDLRRCEALLRDYCGEHRREVFVLLSALREQVVADLRAPRGKQPLPALLGRLSQRLHDHLGIVEEGARWAVESWALALGLATPEELLPPPAQASEFHPLTITQTLVVSPVGPADCRTLAEAVRRATPGTRITVQPGWYQESLVLSRPLEIVGVGPADQIVIEGSRDSCVRLAGGEARLQGLTLAFRSGATGKRFSALDVVQGRLLVEDCDITSDALSCVLVHGNAAHATLRRCQIHHGKECGLHARDNAEVALDDCDIHGNTLAGIDVRQAQLFVRHCRIHGQAVHHGVVVRDNAQGTFEDCDIHGNGASGVVVSHGGRAFLRRSRLHDGRDSGIWFHAHAQGTLEDCDIHGNAASGVVIQQGSAPTLRRCRIHEQAGHFGVYLQANGRGRLEDCDIFANAAAGISIHQESHLFVRGCSIHHHARHNGIRISDKGEAILEDCTLFENAYAGVEIVQSSRLTARRCRIQRNGTYALRVCQNSSVAVDSCDLADNAIGAMNIDPDCQVTAKDTTE